MVAILLSWYALFLSGFNLNSEVQKPISDRFATLIWSDEFDGSSLNPDKWGYEMGNGCPNLCGWGNGEAQYYTDRSDNIQVENGMLSLTAQREAYKGSSFTSARILTKDKFEFTYGRVEVRAKLPQGKGVWPAIWMLGANIDEVGWPQCGEIDIMEHVGNQPDIVHGSIHNTSSSGNTINTRKRKISQLTDDFHVYEMIWEQDKIQFSVDGQVFYTYAPSVKNDRTWPFHKDQFLLMNVAVGGGFGGRIDPNFQSGTMLIDYIRVYQ